MPLLARGGAGKGASLVRSVTVARGVRFSKMQRAACEIYY